MREHRQLELGLASSAERRQKGKKLSVEIWLGEEVRATTREGKRALTLEEMMAGSPKRSMSTAGEDEEKAKKLKTSVA